MRTGPGGSCFQKKSIFIRVRDISYNFVPPYVCCKRAHVIREKHGLFRKSVSAPTPMAAAVVESVKTGGSRWCRCRAVGRHRRSNGDSACAGTAIAASTERRVAATAASPCGV